LRREEVCAPVAAKLTSGGSAQSHAKGVLEAEHHGRCATGLCYSTATHSWQADEAASAVSAHPSHQLRLCDPGVGSTGQLKARQPAHELVHGGGGRLRTADTAGTPAIRDVAALHAGDACLVAHCDVACRTACRRRTSGTRDMPLGTVFGSGMVL
jgi:hypothetical protein